MPIPGLNKTLRVTWPQTTDGINIAVNDETGLPIIRETELPFTAKQFIEMENKRLPTHLRKKIQVMNYTDTPPAETKVKGVGVDLLKKDGSMEDEIAQLRARLAKYEADQKEIEEVPNGEEVTGLDLLGEDDGNGQPIVKKAGRPKKLQNA